MCSPSDSENTDIQIIHALALCRTNMLNYSCMSQCILNELQLVSCIICVQKLIDFQVHIIMLFKIKEKSCERKLLTDLYVSG